MERPAVGGLAGWLMERWQRRAAAPKKPHLELVERITLAPRQTLSLVEVDGRRFLVATSAEAAPSFYSLGRGHQQEGRNGRMARVSW